MTNQNEPDMLLPEGFTCDECCLFNKCCFYGITQEKNSICDFSPSKFLLDPDKYNSLRTRVETLEAALKEIADSVENGKNRGSHTLLQMCRYLNGISEIARRALEEAK